jgi:Transglycosylase SLT domain
MPQVGSTNCRVLIVAPRGTRFHFAQGDYEQQLLAVETQKDLGESVGSFTLHFTATLDTEGRRWDQIIPKRSLVVISMERPGHPELHVDDTTVMVGLTDEHSVQETWEGAAPRRVVRIRGREMSSVMLDAQLVFHPGLLANPALGTVTMTGPEIGLQTLALVWQPNLAQANESPIEVLSRILDYFLFVGGQAVVGNDVPHTQRPLMQLDLPDLTLPEVLVKNREHWNTFLPGVVLPMPYQASEAGSLWNYLHLFIDRAFQEFFTRVEDGVCKIHFRGRPYRHARITSGTRFKSTDEEPTLQTLLLHEADIVSRATQCQTAQVYNWFLVVPLGVAELFGDPNFLYLINPQVVKEHDHPSFIGRYGLHPMVVKSPYLAPFTRPGPGPGSPGGAPATVQPFTSPPPGAALYAPLANQIATQYGLPPALRPWFVASIEQESAFDPLSNGTSGEQGLGQLMPATQAHFGVTQPYDPTQSLTGAVKYWNELRADPLIGDNPQLIVAGYNAGPGAVHAAGGKVPTSAEAHVRNVTARVPRYQGYAGATAPATPVPPTPVSAVAAQQQALSQAGVIHAAEHWASILLGWYDMGGELFAGTLTVRGHPAWNVGHRLLSSDERGPWEAYIEGVAHRYDMRTGQYHTHLRYTRGWYLSVAISAQLWLEGQTTITEVSGGPPTLDPATGQPASPLVSPARFEGTPLIGVRPQPGVLEEGPPL